MWILFRLLVVRATSLKDAGRGELGSAIKMNSLGPHDQKDKLGVM